MYKEILDLFPPPEFLDIPYTGISISDDFIRSIRFTKKKHGLSLEVYNEKPIPVGVVSSGVINSVGELAAILEALKKELNIKYARVSLPEEKEYLFTTTIPAVSKKEIRSTIEFKIEENIPLSADEVVFDYIITNPINYKKNLDVIVSAIPTKIVEAYIEALKKAGISILSLETKSQAVTRAILTKSANGTFIVMHFGPNKAGLYVVNDRTVHFTSTIMFEGEPRNNISFLSNEIRKLEAYWSSFKEEDDAGEKHIDQIIICGENIDEMTVPYLSANQKIPVILGNVWANAFDLNNTVPPIPFMDSLKYAPAIGLAVPTTILI